MKYILMMNATQEVCEWFTQWPKEDLQANAAFMHAFSQELREAGAFVATEGLAFPNQAKLVTAADDGTPVTDGIFPEAKEFLMGYWIVDVESAEEAYRIAARAAMAPAPAGTKGRMRLEVRQIMSGAAKEFS